MILNILDNATELWMTKYIIGESFSSGGVTLYKNLSDQTVYRHFSSGGVKGPTSGHFHHDDVLAKSRKLSTVYILRICRQRAAIISPMAPTWENKDWKFHAGVRLVNRLDVQ